MSGSPYQPAAVLAAKWRAERDRLYRERQAFAAEVPDLDAIREAYAADEIDVLELELLTEAAVAGRAVELPAGLRYRVYERQQGLVRFSDAPGQIVPYNPIGGSRYR